MFDPDAVLDSEQLVAVLEAARWAATWGHRQPVRFIVGLRGDDTFREITELLKRGNRYSHAAGALIMVCIDEGEDERTARYAAVDAGAAIAQLTIEAVSRGLVAHPMAGFNADGACEVFGDSGGRASRRGGRGRFARRLRERAAGDRRARRAGPPAPAAGGRRLRGQLGYAAVVVTTGSGGAGVGQLREGFADLAVQCRHLVCRGRGGRAWRARLRLRAQNRELATNSLDRLASCVASVARSGSCTLWARSARPSAQT